MIFHKQILLDREWFSFYYHNIKNSPRTLQLNYYYIILFSISKLRIAETLPWYVYFIKGKYLKVILLLFPCSLDEIRKIKNSCLTHLCIVDWYMLHSSFTLSHLYSRLLISGLFFCISCFYFIFSSVWGTSNVVILHN